MKNNKKYALIAVGIFLGIWLLIPKKDHTETIENRTLPETVEKKDTGSSTNPIFTSLETSECKRIRFKHLDENRDRDLEDFTDDLNAFKLPETEANTRSVCMKVNKKPVHHRIRNGKQGTEVWVGSVIGPDSEIELSYCIGKSKCHEPCTVRSSNKVDDLINEEELSVLGDREMEMKVKELGKIAENQNKLMDGSVIRDWNRIGTETWSCNHQ
jgi:hypothetical protein